MPPELGWPERSNDGNDATRGGWELGGIDAPPEAMAGMSAPMMETMLPELWRAWCSMMETIPEAMAAVLP